MTENIETFVMAGSWIGVLGSVGLTVLAFLAQKYVVPFLQVGHRQKYAEYIADIADEITDEMRLKYPDKEWLQHLDEAVDQLIQICGISSDVARRAINAAASRK